MLKYSMRLIIQRVSQASVTKKETKQIVGQINKGLFVLIGIKKGDTEEYASDLANKLVKLRIMSDDKDKMNLNILDTTKEILVVSQFTIYANTKDGNRPSFIDAEDPAKAKEIYEYFIDKLKKSGVNVATGSFGDYMEITAKLDGPVTIIIEN
jgi:D-tyrosyl-tRNA(Tyr) deacylase